MVKFLFACVLMMGFLFGVEARADKKGKATLYRDSWGVPYIFADTDEAAAYALGYAQAEDRLEDLFINVRIATGRLAEVLGPDYVDSDYIMRLVDNEARCRAAWDSASPEVRSLSEHFIQGVRAFMAEHPDAVPACALELQPWHPLAIVRAMILNWPLGTLRDEVKREPNTLGWGSNEWAVAPSRSAEPCSILLADPHLTWKQMSVFFEAHVFGRKIAEQHGFFIVGTYGIAYGHTADVGWAPTTGGPDTADVYVMKLNPENLLQYEYDGKWRDGEVKTFTIPVKGQDPVIRKAYYTHLGPALAEPDMKTRTVLVGATPYLDDTGQLEQGYRMLTARNGKELYAAMAMNHYMEQNFMYTDRSGMIGYLRVGKTPVRPEGYDWSRPVPGNSSKTQWLGIHPVEDMVQCVNPPEGYMQNCNTSPEVLTRHSTLTPDKYPPYIYNVSWDSINSRGERALQILSENNAMTREAAREAAFDVRDPYWKQWRDQLDRAAEKFPERLNPGAREALRMILDWKGYYLREDRTAPLVRFWRLEACERVDAARVNQGKPLSDDELPALLDALDAAVAHMRKVYGRIDMAWGEIIKVGRGGRYFPCSGADYGSGENANRLRTLLSVGVEEMPDKPGVYLAERGSMAMILMFFYKDHVDSYTCVAWGQSSNPRSPHYMDQGEKLYSRRKFKPVFHSHEEVQQHAESEKVLLVD